MDLIVDLVCKSFGLLPEQMCSTSRKQEFVSARNTAFYLARKHTDLSLEAIGQYFNRRHSTVIKGITNLEREMSRQSPLGYQIAATVALIERNGREAR
jgi:chromosomal replication initiator protein